MNNFTTWFSLLVLLLAVLSSEVYAEDYEKPGPPPSCDPNSDPENCPPWFDCKEQKGKIKCDCDNLRGIVKCDRHLYKTSLFIGYCMTYDSVTNSTLVGRCPYLPPKGRVHHLYAKLPKKASELNSHTCESLHREGPLCAKCKSGYGPAVFSADLKCYNCSRRYAGWSLYLTLELSLVTSFFLIVVFCHISVTRASMNVFLLLSQTLVGILSIQSARFKYSLENPSQILMDILQTCYGIWNLDFFRIAIPPFCVCHKLSNIHVFALYYISALYPLGLIAITYICIELHARDFRIFVWLWRPFHCCFARWRRTWNPKASIIDAFATFLLLSYSKLIYTSCGLINYITIYSKSGEQWKAAYLDPSVKSFGNNPFAIMATIFFGTFIAFPPIFLIMYPTKLFQKCLGCFNQRWHALHAFADAFQGCYKNGTDGTRDYRYFAGLYFLLRIGLFLAYILIPTNIAWAIIGFLFMTASLCFSIFRPYKKDIFNILDCTFLALFALGSLFVPLTSARCAASPTTSKALFVVLFIIAICPLIYIGLYTTYILLVRTYILVYQYYQRYAMRKAPYAQTPNGRSELTAERGISYSSFADRILNPDQYRLRIPS